MVKARLGRIGLIGLGMIGRHFARHLLRANGALTVYDLDYAKMRDPALVAAKPAGSPRELAAGCEIILLSLPSPEAVREAVEGRDGILTGVAKGTVIVDASTIDPASAVALDRAAEAVGAHYLDCPISGGEPGSGGTDGAEAGNITFMVGGNAAAYDRAKPLLHCVGKRSFHLGPAGAGSTVKLISNHIAGLNNLAMMEGFVLGAAAGFSPETLMRVFDGTDAKSFMMTEYFAPRYRRNEFIPGFAIDLMHKDHRLAAALGERLKVPLPLNQLALELYQGMRTQGLGQMDLIEALHVFAERAGVDIKALHPGRRTEAGEP